MNTPAEPIDRASDRPAYKQIADRLRRRMDAGTITAGDRLPSESELTTLTGASRATVRRGLAELIKEGRAEARPGEGVFAVGEPRRLVIRDPIHNLTKFRKLLDSEDQPYQGPIEPAAMEQGFDYRVTVLARKEIAASERVARTLDVGIGETVFVRRRRVSLRRLGSAEPFTPAKLADSYVPLELAVGRIRDERTGPGGLYARIEEQGYHLTHFEESLVFRMPKPWEVRMLHLPIGVPVIEQTRQAFAGDRPVECFLAVLAGDRHEYEYWIQAT